MSSSQRAEYLPVHHLLSKPFGDDAHTAQYSVAAVPRRLDAGAPECLPTGVPMCVRIFDVDDAVTHAENARLGKIDKKTPKIPARKEWWAEERPKIATLRARFPGVVVWESRGGYKFIEILKTPFLIRNDAEADQWKREYAALVAYLLREFGIECDPSCSDWQHFFRLPHATRDGRLENRPVHGDPCEVGLIEYNPTPEDASADLSAAQAKAESLALVTPKGHANWWAIVARWLQPRADGERVDLQKARHIAATRTERAARLVTPRVVTNVEFDAVAGRLGGIVAGRRSGSGERHNIFNAIAGALCERGVAAPDVEKLVRSVAAAAGEDPRSRDSEARSTLRAWATGRTATGAGWLAREAPDVAAALDEVLWDTTPGDRVRAHLDARKLAPAIHRDEVSARIHALVFKVVAEPAGIRVLRCTEGAGKTRQTVAAVIELARQGVRVVILAPDHNVARDIDAQLRAAGSAVAIRYLRGLLSVVGPDGNFECQKRALGVEVARAGHSVVETLCEGFGMAPSYRYGRRLPVVGPQPRVAGAKPCEHRDTCAAFAEKKRGIPSDTRLLVTVHACAGKAIGWLQKEGKDARRLLVIDEGPTALDCFELTHTALDEAASAACYSATTLRWRGVVLRMLAEGLRRAPSTSVPPAIDPLLYLARLGNNALRGVVDWRDAAVAEYGESSDDPDAMLDQFAYRAAYRHEKGLDRDEWIRLLQWAPRPSRDVHQRMLTEGAPLLLQRASAVHAAVARLAAGITRAMPPGPHVPHAERAQCSLAADEDRSIVLLGVAVATHIASALAAQVPTILLDATCDTDVLNAVVNAHPDALTSRGEQAAEIPVSHEDIRVADGELVTRHLLAWADATRRNSLDRCNPEEPVRWKHGVEGALRLTIAHLARHRPRRHPRIGLITWSPLAKILKTAWESPEAPEADATAVALLHPLREAGVELVIGWYGATRGHNEWHCRPDGTPTPCDAIVLFGAPNGRVSAARAMAAALKLEDEWSAVYRRATEAEASQAAGRGRAPWRTEPLLLVAVMPIAPGGWDCDAEVYALPRGRAVALDGAAAVAAVAVHGSARSAAKALGVDRRTVDRKIDQQTQAVTAGANAPTEEEGTPLNSRGIRPTQNSAKSLVNHPAPAQSDESAPTSTPSAAGAPLTAAPSTTHRASARRGRDDAVGAVDAMSPPDDLVVVGAPNAAYDPVTSRRVLTTWMKEGRISLDRAAELLSVSGRSVRRYLSGERAMSVSVSVVP